jgi:hypothetical protein
MKLKDIENRLALLGALVVLVGVTSAATSALADDRVTADRAAVSAEIAEVTAAGGRHANRRIADAAARAIARNSGLGLDIALTTRRLQVSEGAG